MIANTMKAMYDGDPETPEVNAKSADGELVWFPTATAPGGERRGRVVGRETTPEEIGIICQWNSGGFPNYTTVWFLR